MITRIVYTVEKILLVVVLLLSFEVQVLQGADTAIYQGNKKGIVDSFLLLKSEADTLEKQEQFRKALRLWVEARDLTRGVLARPYTESLYRLGTLYRWTDSLELAMENYYLFLDHAATLGMDSLEAKVCSGMASIFTATGNYEKAHEFHLKSIQINESMDNQKGLRRSYYDLGTFFFYFKRNYREALEYFHKAEAIPVGTGEGQSLIVVWLAIGSANEKLGDLESAKKYNFRAYDLTLEKGYKRETGYSLQNIGTTWFKLGKYELALESLQNSIKYFQELNHTRGTIISMNYLGDVYLEMGDHQKQLRFLPKT